MRKEPELLPESESEASFSSNQHTVGNMHAVAFVRKREKEKARTGFVMHYTAFLYLNIECVCLGNVILQ